MIFGNFLQMEKKKQWLILRWGGKEHGNKETEECLHQQPDSLSLSLLVTTWLTCLGQFLDFTLSTAILVQYSG